MNDVRVIVNQGEERLVLSKPAEALPPLDEPRAAPWCKPAPRRHAVRPSSALRDAFVAVVLSVGPAALLGLICWAVLTYGSSVRHLLGLS